MRKLTIAVRLKDESPEADRNFDPSKTKAIEVFHEDCAGGRVELSESGGLTAGFISCLACGEILAVGLGASSTVKAAIRRVAIERQECEVTLDGSGLIPRRLKLILKPAERK